MVVKVYVSGMSGNKEVKKRQQRVLLILDSKNVKYEVIDIAEPGSEEHKDFMQSNSKEMGATVGDQNPRHPLPPQIFNDAIYCGDYDTFDMANEVDEMEKFLKLETADITSSAEIKLENGNAKPASKESSVEPENRTVENGTHVEDVPDEKVQTEEETDNKVDEVTESKEEPEPEAGEKEEVDDDKNGPFAEED